MQIAPKYQYKHVLFVEKKLQLNVSKIEIVQYIGQRSRNISLSRQRKMLKFHNDSIYIRMFMICKYAKIDLSEWPKYWYLVV